MFVLQHNPETSTFSLVNRNVIIGGIRSRLQAIYKIACLIAHQRISARNVISLVHDMDATPTLPLVLGSEFTELGVPAHVTGILDRTNYVIQLMTTYREVLLTTAGHLIAYETCASYGFPFVYFFKDTVGMQFAKIYLSPMTQEFTEKPFKFITNHYTTPSFFTQEDGITMVLSFQESGDIDLISAERLIRVIENSRLTKIPGSVLDN